MATTITQGNELYIPFCNGKSISNSQNAPRIYQSKEAFERHFPKHDREKNGFVLEKYVPELHGKWIYHTSWLGGVGDIYSECSVCGTRYPGEKGSRGDGKGGKFCEECGAKMDLK